MTDSINNSTALAGADERKLALQQWLNSLNLSDLGDLQSLNGDASFRRYFRAGRYIAVDAPPATQKNREFVDVNRRLRNVGLRVPYIFTADLENGFMLLEDLGNLLFASRALGSEQERFYHKAAALLPQLGKADSVGLPPFDRNFILTELEICREWFLKAKLCLSLSDEDNAFLNQNFERLAALCTAQAQGPMHRDFHCRNLMVLPDEALAVIDYQDMVKGPLTYDLASLLFDCYVVLPQPLIEALALLTFRRFKALGILPDTIVCAGAEGRDCEVRVYDAKAFMRDVRVVSLQRHIKVLGIFCRLHLRDSKDGYLKDLPRVYNYVLSECAALPEFNALGEFFKAKVGTAIPGL